MIAPLRPPQTQPARGDRRLFKAHEFVAAALLGSERPAGENGPPLSALAAWAFAIWTAVVTTAYATAMFGWW